MNAPEAHECSSCGARFPGPVSERVQWAIHALFGREVPITRLYVGLCLSVYVATLADGVGEAVFARASTSSQGVLGALIFGAMPTSTGLRWGGLISGIPLEEPWRLVSAGFIHFGVLHLGFNMVALIDLGRLLERQLGSARFTMVLLLSTIGGFVASEWWYVAISEQRGIPTGGISGGLFGLVGAFIGYLYARGDARWKTISVRVGLYTLFLAVLLPVMSGGGVGLNNAAHVGGFVVGAPFGLWLYRERNHWRRRTMMRTIAAVLIGASVTSLALCQTSDRWRAQRAAEQARG